MTLKNLITVLVLGSSTVAVASSASAAPMRDNTWHGPVAAQHTTVVRENHAPVRTEVVRENRAPVRVERTERVVERPIIREQRVIEHRPIIERPIIERPIVRPIIRERFYAHAPAFYGHAPVVIDESYVGSPFVDGQLVIGMNDIASSGVELGSLGGNTYVQEVAIQYANGASQLVQVNQNVDANNPTLDVQTNGTPVASVVIYGQGAALSAAAV